VWSLSTIVTFLDRSPIAERKAPIVPLARCLHFVDHQSINAGPDMALSPGASPFAFPEKWELLPASGCLEQGVVESLGVAVQPADGRRVQPSK